MCSLCCKAPILVYSSLFINLLVFFILILFLFIYLKRSTSAKFYVSHLNISASYTLVLGVHVCSHYHARRLLPVSHPYTILPTPPVIPTYALPYLDLYCLTCTYPMSTEPTGDRMQTAPSYFASPARPTATVHQCNLNCLDL